MGSNPSVATADSVNRTVFSSNGGQTIDRSTNTPWTAMNYTRLADGRLISVAFIPTNDSCPEKNADGSTTFRPVKLQVFTSSDLGKTWTESTAPVTAPDGVQFGMNRGMRVNRGVMQLPDGTILVGAYTNFGPDTNPTRTILLQSTDGGKTFSVRSTVGSRRHAVRLGGHRGPQHGGVHRRPADPSGLKNRG